MPKVRRPRRSRPRNLSRRPNQSVVRPSPQTPANCARREPIPVRASHPVLRPVAAARAESARAPAAPQANAQLGRADEGRRADSLSAFALQSPEQWLQGIADLRRQGRHEEADKSLAEFRKRYPDYRISKEVLEQLEKR